MNRNVKPAVIICWCIFICKVAYYRWKANHFHFNTNNKQPIGILWIFGHSTRFDTFSFCWFQEIIVQLIQIIIRREINQSTEDLQEVTQEVHYENYRSACNVGLCTMPLNGDQKTKITRIENACLPPLCIRFSFISKRALDNLQIYCNQ